MPVRHRLFSAEFAPVSGRPAFVGRNTMKIPFTY